ncbi:MAG: DoxX family membrane protein [Actinobacteria bacterium]|jgi:uncharacterized membrane protein YphA (DoxX/SURF4 family)|uniref:Unannotated protein n=1 Tax=freshwater metagenome TaxID=449393 RepID=A0A6J6KGV2_9ZZZZ|nr:DoxX family membrane protein [Actinomycetota bacterium]MSV64899.1 DoxX family membrane protein [Actinomycetota bacterium]MSX49339.1 DoxX family membrane protein [Actinomycetota bacterium]MSX69148.1 DoxX family membrane protein [Actinomycetota bacterium]MSY15338.1 DoxX family membrane protein [Actinomycetota bacterium]
MSYNIISGLLAVIFLISGLSKVSGTNAGLSGTRDVGINDLLARLIGVVEAIAAVGLIWGLKNRADSIGWYAAGTIWIAMGVAIYAHFRAEKLKSAFPAFFLLTLTTVLMVIK